MADYRNLVKELGIPKNARILEIGPLNRPLILKDEFPYAYYCDIRNTQQIKDLYNGNKYLETTGVKVDIDTIVDIDFVLTGGYEDTFREVEKFDYVIASHVLEHVEDIISILQDIFTILKPSGQFIIYYPDKRYCFDHFREEASFRDAYDVFINKRPALARMVLDFFNSVIPESRPYIFWTLEGIPDLLPQNSTQEALQLFERALNGELMDDVHYWPFSDSGFIKFLYDATRADLLRYACKAFYPTQEYMQEFVVILQNVDKHWNKNNELQNLRKAYGKAPVGFYNSTYMSQRNEISRLQFLIEDAKKDAENWRNIRDVTNSDLIKLQNQLIMAQAQIVNEQATIINTREQYNVVVSENQVFMSRISDLESRANASEARAIKSEAKANEADARANDAEARAIKSEAKANEADARAIKSEAKANEFEAKANEFEAKANEFEAKANEFEAKANEFEAKAIDYKAMADAYKAEIDYYTQSTSWRVTKPFRTIMGYLRKQ